MKPSQNRIDQLRYVADIDGRPFDLLDLESTLWFCTDGDGSEGTPTIVEGHSVLIRTFGPKREYAAVESIQEGERSLMRPLIESSRIPKYAVWYELNRGFPGLVTTVQDAIAAQSGRPLAAPLRRVLSSEPFDLLEAGVFQNVETLFWLDAQDRDYFDFAAGRKGKAARKLRESFRSALIKKAAERLFQGDRTVVDLLPDCGIAVVEADEDGWVELWSLPLPEGWALPEDFAERFGVTPTETSPVAAA